MYMWLYIWPGSGWIISQIIGGGIGRRGTTNINTTMVIITGIISWIILYEVVIGESNVIIEGPEWIEKTRTTYSMTMTRMTVIMITLVTTISGYVHVYARKYMEGEPDIQRFMSNITMFTIYMEILVSADNWIWMFVGWEGVGYTSMILITYWTTRKKAGKGGMKAIIMNRICDTMMICWIGIIYKTYKTMDYETIMIIKKKIKTIGGWTIIIAASGKSAQMIYHTWLPEAMEGPTPVSALLHAATMVEPEKEKEEERD